MKGPQESASTSAFLNQKAMAVIYGEAAVVQALAYSCTARSPGEEKLSLSDLLEDVAGTLMTGPPGIEPWLQAQPSAPFVLFLFEKCLSQSESEFWFG